MLLQVLAMLFYAILCLHQQFIPYCEYQYTVARRVVRVVRSKCASKHGMCECEHGDVRVLGYVRVEMCECE